MNALPGIFRTFTNVKSNQIKSFLFGQNYYHGHINCIFTMNKSARVCLASFMFMVFSMWPCDQAAKFQVLILGNDQCCDVFPLCQYVMSNSNKAALVGATSGHSGIHLWDKADSNFYSNGPNIQKYLHEVFDRNCWCQRTSIFTMMKSSLLCLMKLCGS